VVPLLSAAFGYPIDDVRIGVPPPRGIRLYEVPNTMCDQATLMRWSRNDRKLLNGAPDGSSKASNRMSGKGPAFPALREAQLFQFAKSDEFPVVAALRRNRSAE
jgi:hypothetical protein